MEPWRAGDAHNGGTETQKKNGAKEGWYTSGLKFASRFALKWKAGSGSALKVVGNEKVGGSGMCQTVPIWFGPRRLRFVSLSILPSTLILRISVSALVKQNE
jgi:hypothetical protein